MIAMSNAEGGVHEQPTSKGAIRAPLGNAVIWQDKGRAEEGYMRCVYATRGLQRAGWRPWYLADGRSCPGIHLMGVLLPSGHLGVRSSRLRHDVHDIHERLAKLCEE